VVDVRFRLGLAMGFAAGYVMGSKAGRERYEQIRQGAERLWESSPGRSVRHTAQRAVREATETIRARTIDLTEALPARTRLDREPIPRAGGIG
jgi:hypothetical protein